VLGLRYTTFHPLVKPREKKMSKLQTMRAWQYTSATKPFERSISLNDTALPLVPKTSGTKPSILVQVHAVGLNPADYKLPVTPIIGSLIIKKPAIPGFDFSGIIVELPGGCKTELKPGDAVFGRLDWPYQNGTLAEYTLTQLNGTIALPPGISFVQGAAISTAAITAYQSLEPFIKPGDVVFIDGGSGGVGSFTIQIAKLLGASHVTVTCSPANEERVRSLGADDVIDYRKENVLQELITATKDKGRLFDHVVENVPSVNRLYEDAHHYLKPGGTFVQVAATDESFSGVLLMVKRSLLPKWLGGGKRRWLFLTAKNDLPTFQKLAKWAEEGQLKIAIDSEYEFEETRGAFERLRSSRAKGKVVVKVGSR
jgi:NADPH:quinone reductase-like Zn-dependent oxidoreductase